MNNQVHTFRIVILVICCFIIQCATSSKITDYEFRNYTLVPQLYSDPPRTVAVLPFGNKTDESKIRVKNWEKLIGSAGLDIEIEQEKTEEYLKRLFVRRAFYKHFSVKPYRDLELIEVDQLLQKKGISWAEDLSNYDAEELAGILGVDALIYGDIINLNRIYLGFYSEVSVGCSLRMIDARNGKILWQAEETQKSRAGGGTSLTLTGLAKGIVTASMNMKKIWIFRVSDDLFRKIVEYLPALNFAVEPVLTVLEDATPLLFEPGKMSMDIGKKVNKLDAGTKLDIIREADGWYFVRTETNQNGWVDNRHTIISGDEKGRPFDAVAENEMWEKPGSKEIAGLYDLQGMEFFKEKKFEESLEVLKKAAAYNSMNGALQFHLAWAYKMVSVKTDNNLHDEVVKHLENAVNLSPENVHYLYNLGLAYNEAELYEKAVLSWQKCLEFNPDMENVKDLIAIIKDTY